MAWIKGSIAQLRRSARSPLIIYALIGSAVLADFVVLVCVARGQRNDVAGRQGAVAPGGV